MKLPAVATVAGLTATVATSIFALQAPVAGAVNLPPCIPKIGKLGGHTAITNCGPAVAKLKVAGKTYTFKGGYCESNSTVHASLYLALGTFVTTLTKNNGGASSFTLTIVNSGKLKLDTVSANYGGKRLITIAFVTVKGSLSSGTFSSKASVIGGPATSGSWKCNGSIYKL